MCVCMCIYVYIYIYIYAYICTHVCAHTALLARDDEDILPCGRERLSTSIYRPLYYNYITAIHYMYIYANI